MLFTVNRSMHIYMLLLLALTSKNTVTAPTLENIKTAVCYATYYGLLYTIYNECTTTCIPINHKLCLTPTSEQCGSSIIPSFIIAPPIIHATYHNVKRFVKAWNESPLITQLEQLNKDE